MMIFPKKAYQNKPMLLIGITSVLHHDVTEDFLTINIVYIIYNISAAVILMILPPYRSIAEMKCELPKAEYGNLRAESQHTAITAGSVRRRSEPDVTGLLRQADHRLQLVCHIDQAVVLFRFPAVGNGMKKQVAVRFHKKNPGHEKGADKIHGNDDLPYFLRHTGTSFLLHPHCFFERTKNKHNRLSFL